MNQLSKSNFLPAEKLVLWMQHLAAQQTASILVAGTELPFVIEMNVEDKSVLGLTGSEKFASLDPLVRLVTSAVSVTNTQSLQPPEELYLEMGLSSASESREEPKITDYTPPDPARHVSITVLQ